MKYAIVIVFCAFLFPLLPEARVVVISDIDDTIKFRGHGGTLDPLIHFFRKEIYPGMRDLYRSLEDTHSHEGIDFFYVSGKNSYLFPTEKWLEESGFPYGKTFLRNWNSGAIYPFKKGTVKDILQSYDREEVGELKVLFFGDNTAKDTQIYLDAARELELEDFLVFIREIKENQKTYPGVHYFTSEGELGQHLGVDSPASLVRESRPGKIRAWCYSFLGQFFRG